MKRRDFLGVIGGAVTAWPLAAGAQQRPGKLPTVGFLIPSSRDVYGQRIAATVQRLRELGWIEGRTVAIEYRWAETQRFDEIAAEFVHLKVDVILTGGTPPVLAAQRATSEIPIVFAAAGDPVGSRLIASLARPGGNITGLSVQSRDITSKRIGLLRDIVPSIRRLAIMAKIDNVSAASELHDAEAVAGSLGIETTPVGIKRAEDIEPAIEQLKGRADALYVAVDSLVTTEAARLNALALKQRLPTMHGARELAQAGGLMSYGASYVDIWRRSADYIDKILRGAKPGEIPVEQPAKFELVVNLKIANALRLTVTRDFLLIVDEVIE
jgi:putative tryptophan/tyrosine transport system substrate-binding protein